MPSKNNTMPGRPESAAYPLDFARFISARWRISGAGPAPDIDVLESFLSTCFQASLMREEERPVTFRAILAPPDLFDPCGRPPESVKRIGFALPVPFGSNELRRLSVAADAHRSLIGISVGAEGRMGIWGLLNTGPYWLRDQVGGRRAGTPLPGALVVHVSGSGAMTAYQGEEFVAKLERGVLTDSRDNPFFSSWLPRQFSEFRSTIMSRHASERSVHGAAWAPIDEDLPRTVSERMMKRAVSLLRLARHGGTILFVPTDRESDLGVPDPYVDIRYRIERLPGVGSTADVVVAILNRLAAIHGTSSHSAAVVGWDDFERSEDAVLAALDDALFEIGHLIAGLASVDGAVVINKQNNLLGFGGMIAGHLPPVREVVRAADPDCTAIVCESTENVGSRHNSAYRFVAAMPGAVAVVVSQDGDVRFVAEHNGRVTYWEQE